MNPIVVPANIASWTAARKIAYYAALREVGYPDAEIRAAVEAVVGAQADADWAYLQDQAGYKPGVGVGALAIAAAAAAYFLLG